MTLTTGSERHIGGRKASLSMRSGVTEFYARSPKTSESKP